MKSSLDEPMPDDTAYPFVDYFHAIRWFNTHNPARMICKDPLEDTRGNRLFDEQALFSSTFWAIQAAMRGSDLQEQREWYRLYRLRESWRDVAELRCKIATDEAITIQTAKLKRRMRAINERLEIELRRRKLIK